MSDPHAFDEVYRLYGERVYRFCLSQTRNVSLAEEIAAETFAAAYTAYATRRPGAEMVQFWLFRIARNQINDHYRRSKRWKAVSQLLGRSSSHVEDIEAIAATNADLAEALKVIRQLKRRDQQLISLRVAAELSNREIGNILGISEDAAGVAVFRALQRFRKLREQTRQEQRDE